MSVPLSQMARFRVPSLQEQPYTVRQMAVPSYVVRLNSLSYIGHLGDRPKLSYVFRLCSLN